jgi:hypothetical protein
VFVAGVFGMKEMKKIICIFLALLELIQPGVFIIKPFLLPLKGEQNKLKRLSLDSFSG